MTILSATQTATVNITVPGSYLTITCATGEVMQVDWASPGSITGTRIVRQVTEDVGPFADSTVVTLRALMGNPQYTEGLGGGLTAAEVAALQALVSGGGIAAQPGEVGVVNVTYSVGDVRRYGIFPDTVALASISVSGTSATGSAGTYTAAMVGMHLSCRAFTNTFSKVLSVASDGASAVLQTAAAVAYTGPALMGTQWEDKGTLANVYATMRAGYSVMFPAGRYNMGMNFGGGITDGKMHFEPGAELVSILHLITDGVEINRRVTLTGRVVTYDRFGTIQLRDSAIEAVHVKDGSALGLWPCRGAHIYGSTQDTTIDDLVIDGCSTVNGDAALAIDDTGCARIKIKRTLIKNSDVHGMILEGTAHEFGEVEILGWGKSTYLNAGVGGSKGLAQSMELRGAWLHRSPESKIGTLRIDQLAADSVSCVTANTGTTITAAVAGGLSAIRIGQQVAGTGIADHSLASCGVTSGSAGITGAGFSALVKGQPISGTGIPLGALVLSVASDAAMTLTLPATASGTVTLTAGCVVRTVALDYSSATISNAATASGTATLIFSRPAALYPFIATDSGIGSGPQTMHIDSLIVRGATRRGVSIGDRNFTAACSRVRIGAMDIRAFGGNTQIDVGWSLLHVNAVTSGPASLYGCAVVRFYDTYGSDLLFVGTGGEVQIGLLDGAAVTANGSTQVGRVLQIKGRGSIGEIRHTASAVSSSAVPILIGPSNDGPIRIGLVTLTSVSAIGTPAVDMSSAFDFEIGPIHTDKYTGFPAVLVNGSARGVIRLGKVTGASSAGWGLRFQNNTSVLIEGGKITGFALGTTGSAGNNTRCGVRGLEVSGNTSNTDLASGQLVVDGTSVAATL